MESLRVIAVLSCLAIIAAPVTGQARPDFSGVWRLEPTQSHMIGGGVAPSDQHQLTWLVNHREPEIAVVVNVRDAQGSHEFSFRCTTDGRECVNELPQLNEVRRMSAAWEGEVLVMSQRATTPHGAFEARDRLSLSDSGQRLVFERIVVNDRGERPVRQVFRKLGPHPSQRAAPQSLPTTELPPQLDRVLREYEQHWRAGNVDELVALFTEDGFAARRGGWIRGRERLRQSLEGTSSDLRLRAVAYEVDGRVGYIVGAYAYGEEPSADRGMFMLTLRRTTDGRWLIAADLDGTIRP
jgi:ketosteroid isomerase-like protein